MTASPLSQTYFVARAFDEVAVGVGALVLAGEGLSHAAKSITAAKEKRIRNLIVLPLDL